MLGTGGIEWAAIAAGSLGFLIPVVIVTFALRRYLLRGVTFAGIALVGVTALAAATQQFSQEVTFDTDGETLKEALVRLEGGGRVVRTMRGTDPGRDATTSKQY